MGRGAATSGWPSLALTPANIVLSSALYGGR